MGLTLRDLISSFYLPKQNRPYLFVLAVVALALAGCRKNPAGSPDLTPASTRERLRADLSLLPSETRIVLSLDLERLRGQPAWKEIQPAILRHAKGFLEGLATGSGIDGMRSLRHLVLASPGQGATDDRFILLADVESADIEKAAAWLRQQLPSGGAVVTRGRDRIVIATGPWAPLVATLANASKLPVSAADDMEMRRLCERSAGEHPFWMAAVVPAQLRQTLASTSVFPDLGSIARISGFVDLTNGLRGGITAELSNAEDAGTLASRLSGYVHLGKRHPDMLVHGLSPYVENLRVVARDVRVVASLDLPGAQLSEFIERMEALAHATWTK